MRKIIGKLAAVLFYICILCGLLKSAWTQLFSPKMMGLLLLGTGILCLPYISRKRTIEEWQNILAKHALMAGYLEAFMLLFASMSSSELMREGLLMEMGLDLRPILYGYVLYIILEKENEEQEGGGPKREADHQKQDKPAAAEAEQKMPQGENAKEEISWDMSKLTRRERQVAELIAKDLSNREIAEELYISEATVKKHVSNIFEKLEIKSRKELKQNLKQ